MECACQHKWRAPALHTLRKEGAHAHQCGLLECAALWRSPVINILACGWSAPMKIRADNWSALIRIVTFKWSLHLAIIFLWRSLRSVNQFVVEKKALANRKSFYAAPALTGLDQKKGANYGKLPALVPKLRSPIQWLSSKVPFLFTRFRHPQIT